MNSKGKAPVYTELDEQRFNIWLERLEKSYKTYLADEGLEDKSLMDTIRNTIESDVVSFPTWISNHKHIAAGKIASSSDEMKLYLRHVAFPHVLASYGKIIDEICPPTATSPLPVADKVKVEELSEGMAPECEHSNSNHVANGTADVASAAATAPAPAPVASFRFPMHTAPICSSLTGTETTVDDFFRGLVAGQGDGLVNLCKLADITHRINRAGEHDTHQVGQWIENEKHRRDANTLSLTKRQERLLVLRGEDNEKFMAQSMDKLKSEVGVLNGHLAQAVMEEDEAKKAYEAAILRRKQAAQNIQNLENYIDNVVTHRELLQKVNDLRIEADKFNIASAEKRMAMFQGMEKYVHCVREKFVQQRLAQEMPALFDNLVAQLAASMGQNGHSTGASVSGAGGAENSSLGFLGLPVQNGRQEDRLSLYCAARVGLETLRIWKQLNLPSMLPSVARPIEEFHRLLATTLAQQTPPSPTDAAAQGVYRASNSTVVLFFDHLQHDTPEDHVEAQSRVLTCLKMLTDHLKDDPPHSQMEVDSQVGLNSLAGDGPVGTSASQVATKGPRSMKLLNCNDILAPPVWCLPLAHSPQYLAQLWRLAEEAHNGDLYVPLEFDTEWISEDPYHTSSDEDGPKRVRAPSLAGTLLKSVELEEPWHNALDGEMQKSFTELLTPAPSDHVVAKVIRRMEQRAASKAIRSARPVPSLTTSQQPSSRPATSSAARVRSDDRSSSSSLAPQVAYAAMRPEMDGAAVKTPMGPGTIVLNGRRDGMVSVKLQWGAVGHFRRECIVFPQPAATAQSSQNGQSKLERPSYSSAQAFYVAGSAGRFVHNDMEIHNTMCRLISLVKIQRIIGDMANINHANLSLFMHGRTSGGLTRTIEATISRFLEKYDEQKLADLLDYGEACAARGAPLEPQDFLRMLASVAMPPGQVSTVRTDRSLGRPVAFVPSGSTATPAAPAPAPKKLALAPPVTAPIAASIKSEIVAEPAPILPEIAAPGLPSSPLPAAKPKPEKTKAPTDVRQSAKYTKDGEVLRELMSSIMRTLKLSQGSIANEYYRCFRYETSQGGVSAWFHFRGNSVVFEGMNHCALMWVDDHKQHLTAEEQRIFAEINARMSHHSPGHPHPERTPTPVPNAPSTVSDAAASQPETLTAEGTSSTSDVIAWDEVEPIPLPAAEETSLSGAVEDPLATQVLHTANQEVVSEDGNDQDQPRSDDSAALRDVKEEEEEEQNERAESSGQMEVEGESLFSAGEEEAANFAPTQVMDDGAIDRDDSSEEDAGAADQKGGDAVDPVKPEDTEPAAASATAAVEVDELPAPFGTIRSIEDLHMTLVYEMSRRKVSQSRAAVEANLRNLGMGQPALSKFLAVATLTNNERGRLFSGGMINWVKYSRTQPSSPDWDPTAPFIYKPPAQQTKVSVNKTQGSGNLGIASFKAADDASVDGGSLASETAADELDGADSRSTAIPSSDPPGEELTCGLCGKLSTEFSNIRSFHMHLAWCYRRKTTNPQRSFPEPFIKPGATVVDYDMVCGKKRKSHGGGSEGADQAKRARPVAAAAAERPTTQQMPAQNISNEAMRDTYIVTADSYAAGAHYDTCEVCHEPGDVILCDGCPCIYHMHCARVTDIPEGTWFCAKCTESGACNGEVIPEERKDDPSLVESWVLIYSDSLHRWRKAVVLALHPQRSKTLLVKWWRSDNKGGKSNWVYVGNARVLAAIPEKAGLQPPRPRNSSSTNLSAAIVTGSRERSQIVRFDPTVERKGSTGTSAATKFKDGQASMLHMDGENGASVPPLVRASAAGVGGVGALRDGEYPDRKASTNISGAGMSDTYISRNSLKAALCAAGSACRAVDIAICNDNTNVFACTRPPGHHAGRYGCTSGCLSTGFCMLNNAAIAAIYARVRWGLERVAVVDIDVHFGNGTAELLRNDPNAFFASVHMIYGEDNDGSKADRAKRRKKENRTTTDAATNGEKGKVKSRAADSMGFYPAQLGVTEITDTYVSVGVYPTLEGIRLKGVDGIHRRRRKAVATSDSESSDDGAEEEEEVVDEPEGAMMVVDGAEGEGVALPAPDAGAELPQSPTKRVKKSASAMSLGAVDASKRTFKGAAGFLSALQDVIIPQMEKFNPQLLVISAGFDGYVSDPLGGQLSLSLEDYKVATKMLMSSMDRLRAAEPNPAVVAGKVISLLEGGYDTSPFTLGLAKCVDAHVVALQEG